MIALAYPFASDVGRIFVAALSFMMFGGVKMHCISSRLLG